MPPMLKPYSPWTPAEVRAADGRRRAVPESMTPADFMAFPWPERECWELINGTPVMSPSPVGDHQQIASAVVAFWKAAFPGDIVFHECDVLLPDRTQYLRPDACVIAGDAGVDTSVVPVVARPTLVLEVLSPSTASTDLGAKRDIYAQAGVEEYWIVDPLPGVLSVWVGPAEAGYQTQQRPDADGYVLSPRLGQAVRVRQVGPTFEVQARSG